MTAPTLTPMERDEALRFGIHDEDVIEDLEKHWGDDLLCAACDDAPAVVLHVMLCCGNRSARCGEYSASTIADLDRCLQGHGCVSTCHRCHHRVLQPRTHADLFKVVPL